MNAPTTKSDAAAPERTDALPWNLVPYADGGFEAMHGPGSMLVSSSNLAALFGLIPERLGRLSYALHLKGERPLPDIGDEPQIKLGNYLEPFVARQLAAELGGELVPFRAYAKHEFLPLYATPDFGLWLDGKLYMVEIKTVGPKVFYEKWKDGPPIHNNLQHQGQFACTGAEQGIICVFERGYCQLEHFVTEPHPAAIERIELGVEDFMATLARGELPDPDDHEVDADAWRELKWQSDPEKTIRIEGHEAERRARQFLQAKLDEAAATKTIEAQKRWFQARMADAQVAKTEGVDVTWKTNKSKSKGADRPNRVFSMKEAKEREDG